MVGYGFVREMWIHQVYEQGQVVSLVVRFVDIG